MCGIAGFIGADANWEKEIKAMCDRMRYRGPDDEGKWLDGNTGLVFGHRRLSILDLSSNGKQPMMSQNGRYVIVFNGEIYNYQEVGQELYCKSGVVFKTKTDTEVLLEAISCWGMKKSLDKIRGMFAFAVYDRKEKILSLARDRMGEKPLYYGWVNQKFAFASDLACLEQMKNFNNELCREAVKLFMQHGYIPAPYSIYKNIYKLDAGTYININVLTGKEIDKEIYWSAEKIAISGKENPFRGTEEEAAEELKGLLKKVISMQRLADVPVGAFLSAGIDSSTVVALMQEVSELPVKTFTIGVESEQYNEAIAAKEIARILGTDHTELYITEKEARNIVQNLCYYYTEPFADSSQIPTLLVSRLARDKVKVSLSGDGGDELFAGYKYYDYVGNVWKQISGYPKAIRTVGGWAAYHMPIFNKTSVALKGRVFVNKTPEDLYCWSRKSGTEEKLFSSHIDAESKNDISRKWIFEECQENIMLMDMQMYLPDDILVKVDRAAMACSLETRIPMLAPEIIQFAWSLPFSYKKENGVTKKILRNIIYQYIPKEIIDRPKTGFSIPISKWLMQGDMKDWAEDIIGSSVIQEAGIDPREIIKMWDDFKERGIWKESIWRVLILNSWIKNHKFFDGMI